MCSGHMCTYLHQGLLQKSRWDKGPGSVSQQASAMKIKFTHKHPQCAIKTQTMSPEDKWIVQEWATLARVFEYGLTV